MNLKIKRRYYMISMMLGAITFSYLGYYGLAIFAIILNLTAGILTYLEEKDEG